MTNNPAVVTRRMANGIKPGRTGVIHKKCREKRPNGFITLVTFT
jgi:hypothetical protein